MKDWQLEFDLQNPQKLYVMTASVIPVLFQQDGKWRQENCPGAPEPRVGSIVEQTTKETLPQQGGRLEPHIPQFSSGCHMDAMVYTSAHTYTQAYTQRDTTDIQYFQDNMDAQDRPHLEGAKFKSRNYVMSAMKPIKIKLEINNKNTAGKFQNAYMLNKIILNNICVKEEISRHLKIF